MTHPILVTLHHMATYKVLILSIGKIFYNCKAQALANDHFMFLGALCNINKIMQLSELFSIVPTLKINIHSFCCVYMENFGGYWLHRGK